MDGGADQHAITDVINSETGDIFIVIRAAVNDDVDPLKRQKVSLC